jgi:hypothetical protein
MGNFRTVLISGCDANYFPLLRELVTSTEPHRRARGFDLAIMDYGLADDQVAWLRAHSAAVAKPGWRLEISHNPADKGGLIFSSRLFFPDEFPGYDVYFWIDADAWLQTPETLDAFAEGAMEHGAAVVAEHHPYYRFHPRLKFRNVKHFIRGYGLSAGLWLERQPHINMGVFAIRRDAPHWVQWRRRLVAAAMRSGRIAPHDQFAFNQIVYQDKVPTLVLPPELNWIPDKGSPAWDARKRLLVTPDKAHKPLGIVHLAGDTAKGKKCRLQILDGGVIDTEMRYSKIRPLYDAESPDARSA